MQTGEVVGKVGGMSTSAAKGYVVLDGLRSGSPEEKREKLRLVLMIVGSGLLDELRRLRSAGHKRMLEDLAAEGDEAAALEWWETYGAAAEQKAGG